ncbi:hypothetical protein ACFL1B_06165 [Nanoarchaeota archaeon]
MGKMTFQVDDEVERIFRKRVSQLYGRKKGALGQALKEAMLEWTKRTDYFDECMQLLEEGADLGGITQSRREMYH